MRYLCWLKEDYNSHKYKKITFSDRNNSVTLSMSGAMVLSLSQVLRISRNKTVGLVTSTLFPSALHDCSHWLLCVRKGVHY